jgi:hypothetical protein
MRIDVYHQCADATSYRAARIKSLFNVDDGSFFDLEADLPIDGLDWKIGAVVGPSGSGKSSIGGALFGAEAVWGADGWPVDAPIIDAIAPAADFDQVTGALSAVGLGSVPAWLRPYQVLSTGERFRADLARFVCAAPARAVVDEFTGFSIPGPAAFPGGGFSDIHQSNCGSSRPTGDGGRILSRITI